MVPKEIWDKLELIAGNLYIRGDNGDWNKICAITDITESCSMLDRAKKVIKEHIESAMCGIFNTRNCAGDYMETICDEDNLTIDICYEYEYFEVFGLSRSDFDVLEDFYETLRKEVRAKEKETTEMADYSANIEVIAERGVGCIIQRLRQEETMIRVKIIKHAGGKYEVIYKNYVDTPWHSYTKFYDDGLPVLANIRDDIQHFYMAGCINVQDIMALLDEAVGVIRRNTIAKQLVNSRYGLASADIQDCFVGMEHYGIPGQKWGPIRYQKIECKITGKDQYRNREKLPEISEVIFNKPATIVKWADGTKTVVKVQGKERYNKEKGLAMAIAKKAMGNSNYYYTIMERYLEGKKK